MSNRHDHFHNLEAVIKRRKVSMMRHFRTALLTGLLTLIPLGVSAYILITLFNLLTAFSQPIARFLLTHVIAPLFKDKINEATFTAWTAPVSIKIPGTIGARKASVSPCGIA